MKKNYKAIAVRFVRPSYFFSTAVLLFLGFAIKLSADAPPALTSIQRSGVDAEGRAEYTLEWDAASNTVYRLQQRSGFESNTTWETFDLAVPGGPRGAFQVRADKLEAGAEGIRRAKFFQVLMPQAEILSIEPALMSTNGGTSYLFGQCLGTNPTLRIGGLVIPASPLQPGSVYTFS